MRVLPTFLMLIKYFLVLGNRSLKFPYFVLCVPGTGFTNPCKQHNLLWYLTVSFPLARSLFQFDHFLTLFLNLFMVSFELKKTNCSLAIVE